MKLLLPFLILLFFTGCQRDNVHSESNENERAFQNAEFDHEGALLVVPLPDARYSLNAYSERHAELSVDQWKEIRYFIDTYEQPVYQSDAVFENQRLLHYYRYLADYLYSASPGNDILGEIADVLNRIIETGYPIEWDILAHGVRLLDYHDRSDAVAAVRQFILEHATPVARGERPENGETNQSDAQRALALLST